MEIENLQQRIAEIGKHEVTLRKMEDVLSRLEAVQGEWSMLQKDFKQMMDYYTGENRYEDLKLDEQGLLKDVPRGVLSQDEIYDVFTSNSRLCFNMMRTALDYLQPGG